ncbi:Zinc finger, CCCH-type, partial [Dillenia turbinata]
MPLGKYYCDYCDKEFADTLHARKRHLQSVQHQRARSLWFDSFKDPTSIPIPKGVCNRFVRTGFCPYGDSCKYAHPQPHPNVQDSNSQGIQVPVLIFQSLYSWKSTDIGDIGISWGNLPSSLWPPPEGGYPPLPVIDWVADFSAKL